jgi:hypothetical protein
MSPSYFVGIDVAVREHRVAILGPGSEAVVKCFSTSRTMTALPRSCARSRSTAPRRTERSWASRRPAILWENLEGHLARAGYPVVVLARALARVKDGALTSPCSNIPPPGADFHGPWVGRGGGATQC